MAPVISLPIATRISSFLMRFEIDFIVNFLSEWLNIPSILKLDYLMKGSKSERALWAAILSRIKSSSLENWMEHTHKSVRWHIDRGVQMGSSLEFVKDKDAGLNATTFEGLSQQALRSVIFNGKNSPQDCHSFELIAQGCPSLAVLDARWGSGFIDDSVLVMLGTHCDDLHTLKCGSISASDEGFTSFVQKCSRLGDVEIMIDNPLSDAAATALATACGETLRRLDLSYSNNLADSGLKSIALKCTNLEDLNLSYCDQISDVGVKAIAERNPNLLIVEIENSRVGDASVVSLAQNCRGLREVNFANCGEISNIGLQKLGECCSNLEKASFSGNQRIGNEGVTRLVQGCPKMRELYLSECSEVNDQAALAMAQHCSQLRIIGFYDTALTDVGLKELARKCVLLEKVWVDGTGISDNGLMTVVECCSNLKEMHLDDCLGITDIGITALVERFPEVEVRTLGTSVSVECKDSLRARYPLAVIHFY